MRRYNRLVQMLLLFLLALPHPRLMGENLEALATFNPSSFELLDIFIDGDYAYIPGGLGGLAIVDISDPTQPQSVGRFQASGCDFNRVYAWTVYRNIAYGSGRDCGIQVINVENPSQPIELDAYSDKNANYENTVMIGSYLYAAAHGDGVEIIGAEANGMLSHLKWIATENAWAVAPSNDEQYLCIADGSAGLKIVDISNPSLATIVGTASTSGTAKHLAVVGDYIFVAVGAAGVDMFDVSDPTRPRLVANYNTSGYASRVSAQHNLVAVSDWDDVEVLRWTATPTPTMTLDGYKSTGGRVMAIAMQGDIIYSAEWDKFRVFRYGEINGPDIDAERRDIRFTRLEEGYCETARTTIYNTGSTKLSIIEINPNHSDFTVSPKSGQLQPGDSLELTIEYCASGGSGVAKMTIESNDPDENHIGILLRGNPSYGVKEGDLAYNFLLPVINGTGEIGLDQFRGQVVLLAFFATW